MKVTRRLLLVASFIVLFFGIWQFVHGNGHTVEIDYVFGHTPELALWKALAGAAAAGVVVTGVVLGWWLLLSRLESRRYRKALVEMESEVHQLRNLPLVGAESMESSAAPAGASGGMVQAD